MQQSPEQLLGYRVDLQIQADGTLLVTERIAYDFGTEERHGIFRDVPVRFRYDDRYDRVYPSRCWRVQDRLGHRLGDPGNACDGRWRAPGRAGRLAARDRRAGPPGG